MCILITICNCISYFFYIYFKHVLNPQFLVNQDYTNCIRTEKGYCAVEWKEKTGATPGNYDYQDDDDYDYYDHDHDHDNCHTDGDDNNYDDFDVDEDDGDNKDEKDDEYAF